MAGGAAVTAGREAVVSVGAASVNFPSGATLAISGLLAGAFVAAGWDVPGRDEQPAAVRTIVGSHSMETGKLRASQYR